MEEESDDYPLLIHLIIFVLKVVFVVLFIVFTLLTLGIFLPDDKPVREQRKNGIPSIEEKLRLQLQRKRNRLVLVRQRISELQLIVAKIRANERRVLFFVRLLIISLLVLVNWQYLLHFRIEPTTLIQRVFQDRHAGELPMRAKEIVELVTNFNALIVLLYSIPAYLLYGTVGRFTKAMKAKTVAILRKKHIPTLSELQLLRDEEQQLIRDIGYLKNSLEIYE